MTTTISRRFFTHDRSLRSQNPSVYSCDSAEKRFGPGKTSISLDGNGSVKIKRAGENPITLELGAAYEIAVGSDGSLNISKTTLNPVDLGKRSAAPSASATLDAAHKSMMNARDAETQKLSRMNELNRKMWDR